MKEKIQHFLAELQRNALYREPNVICNGLLNFSSNDYLSLRNNPELQEAFIEGFRRYPIGSGSSRVVCGFHEIHQQLEEEIARQLKVDAALLFVSGYSAILSLLNLLANLGAKLYIDKQVHASVYDGIKLAGLPYERYLHTNYEDLTRKLTSPHAVVLSESVFSMTGQIADLNALAQVCASANAALIVDEAHAFGVMGPQGLGQVAEHALSMDQVPLRIIGFGKALGCQGAVIAGEKNWIDALFQTGRSHIYSTALSPAFSYGLLGGVKLLRHAEVQRIKLKQLIYYFQQKIKQSALKWRSSDSPIQQLQLGCPKKALAYATHLREKGIVCLAMREPTVSRKETGLRVVLNAHHEPEDINQLLYEIQVVDEH